MKKILITICLLLSASNVFAGSCETNLMPAFTSAQASRICTGTVFNNNTFIKVRNAANTANLNILKVDATDDTVLNADTGDSIKFQVAETTEMTLNNDELVLAGANFQFVSGTSTIAFRNSADSQNNVVIDDTGAVSLISTLASTRTTDLGWSVVNAANQACNTTCTNACVFGFNTGALGNLLSCSDATADSCLCAGAS